jgi:hypothetical protein
MRVLISILFISLGTLAFSQSNLTLPDSLLNRKFKPISLHLGEMHISDKYIDNWTLDASSFTLSSNGFHFGLQKGGYNIPEANILNPNRVSGPVESLIFGVADVYSINKNCSKGIVFAYSFKK